MGWQPDLPDSRDYSHGHPAVLPSLRKLKRLGPEELPDEVDLRFDSEGEYFTQPLDQGPLNSSTAFAVLSLIEYFEPASDPELFHVEETALARWRLRRYRRL